jgi:hypothetical protein
MVVKMEPDEAHTPSFAPSDYLDEAELERILPKLGEEAGLAPGDFVDERHLDTIIGLVNYFMNCQTKCVSISRVNYF